LNRRACDEILPQIKPTSHINDQGIVEGTTTQTSCGRWLHYLTASSFNGKPKSSSQSSNDSASVQKWIKSSWFFNLISLFDFAFHPLFCKQLIGVKWALTEWFEQRKCSAQISKQTSK
jgi:hypothetical protein